MREHPTESAQRALRIVLRRAPFPPMNLYYDQFDEDEARLAGARGVCMQFHRFIAPHRGATSPALAKNLLEEVR